jgi:hypothetical protein
MAQANWWLIPIAALIPLILGNIWYHKKVFGNAWMASAEISEERAQSGNMVRIIGLTYLFSILAAYMLTMLSVHQSGMIQLFLGDEMLNDANSEAAQLLASLMDNFGERHRTFGHGLIHGLEAGLFFGLSLIGINTLFERRPFKYAMIHIGFFMLCFGLIGGVLCAYF